MPFTLKITWKTKKDPLVCPICRALEGYTWILKGGVDPYPTIFVHPVYGTVYDTRPAAEGSQVKEENGHTCRCTLKHEFDLSNMLNNIQQMQNNELSIAANKKQCRIVNDEE